MSSHMTPAEASTATSDTCHPAWVGLKRSSCSRSRGPATDLKRNRLTSSCMQKGHLTLPSSLQVNKTYRRSANPAGARENGTAPPARPGSRRWQEDRQLAKREIGRAACRERVCQYV